MHFKIRDECLTGYSDLWPTPTGDEVREIIRMTTLTGGQVAKLVGLTSNGSRTVRRWVSGESPIPYAVWAILCDCAGYSSIWLRGENQSENKDDINQT
ncbi:transcriptional regulator [Methylomonas sp. Kb3]|nr:transcriptional regulator [Methylomonas sp. Kb3]